jgi:hypothetical protein
LPGNVDERANQPHSRVVRHRTSSSLYRGESVPRAAAVTPAAAARRLLGNLGCGGRGLRCGPRADTWQTKVVIGQRAVARSRRFAASPAAVVDTDWLMQPYLVSYTNVGPVVDGRSLFAYLY